MTFFDDLVILFEQNLTVFVHLASTLYLFPSWQCLGIFQQLYVERLLGFFFSQDQFCSGKIPFFSYLCALTLTEHPLPNQQ